MVKKQQKPLRVTIIGGGFGGVRTARQLAKNPRNEITLISDREDFQYYPALYSSATGHSRLESWAPLGEIFANTPNVHVYIDTIDHISATGKTIRGSSGTEYSYDVLVMAIGVITTYFGIPGLENFAYGIKSEAEITKLKQRLFTDIAENHRLDRNYIIVGAGPTGVELAATLRTYIKQLCKRYGVKQHGINVRLVEAAPRVLPRSSELTSRVVANRLRKLGVDVQTGKKVEGADATSLTVSGKAIASHTVIWTSGVANNPLFSKFPKVFTLDKRGKVVVDDYMQAHKDIYVIGDNAARPYAGLAQIAVRDADALAENLTRKARGKKLKKYVQHLPVTAIPVGHNWAVVEWKFVRIFGLLGGMIRRAADLIGYHDVMPTGTTLKAWRAANVREDEYFTPTVKIVKRK